MTNDSNLKQNQFIKWEELIPPVPENEETRLRALKSYQILDTLPEPGFDSLAKLASHICKTPFAFITLIDSDRIWFKSRVGDDVPFQTLRGTSFCQFTILGKEIFEIENTLQSPFSKNNPLVTGYPNIRFYAGTPFQNSDGLNIGTLCVIDNEPKKLTKKQRKALEMLAKQITAQLELRSMLLREKKMGEVKSRFVSLISHQFRTPLSVIKSNVELLEMLEKDLSSGNKRQIQKCIQRIQDEIEQMTDLMNNVLTLNQLNRKHMNYNPSSLNVEEVIQNVIKRIEHIQKDGRKVNAIIKGKKRSLSLDKNQFEISLSNILSNAFKYSSDSNPELQIDYQEDSISITISDEGIGIPEEDIREIFKPFYRSDNAILIRGTGLGLTIAKEITEMNGGSISVQSNINKKTTVFTLVFPTSKQK